MNFFKYIVSFLFPVKVEERKSVVSGRIEVLLSRGRYVMDSAHVNYSFGGLHKVFQQVFMQAGIKEKKINTALVLGFGGGSVASILQEEYGKQVAITGVEKDPEIIALARNYFFIDKYRDLNLIGDDAYDFVFCCTGKFNLVVMDVFIDRNVPEKFYEQKFLSQLGNLLSEEGMLFFNLVVYNEKMREKGAKLFKDLTQLVGKTEWCRIHSCGTENWVFISQK